MADYVPDVNEDDNIFEWQKESRVKHKRKLEPSCECGISTSETVFSWNALVEIKDRDGKDSNKYCSGSVINSKFILTGYTCLLQGKNYIVENAKHAWVPGRHVLPSEVTVFMDPQNLEVFPHTQSGFKVLNVFYNLEFVGPYSTSNHFQKNVALIELKGEIDFIGTNIRPICLGNSKILQRHAEIFEIVAWAKVPLEPRVQAHVAVNVSGYFHIGDCRRRARITIPDGNICTLSFPNDPHKLDESGNSLIGLHPETNNTSGPFRAIQIGVGSFDDSEEQLNHHEGNYHEYFTTVESVMQYIEYYSEKHSAVWCHQPDYLTSTLDNTGSSKGLLPRHSYSWESTKVSSDERKIDTSCTCGMTDVRQHSRIVGGTTASPYEFRWQVYMEIQVLHRDSSKRRTHLCGGSIINNRFILTAAHCLVQQTLLEDGKYPAEVSPEHIKAFIHIHTRKNDAKSRQVKVKAVLCNGRYEEARTDPNDDHFDYDVCLLELEKPLHFDDDVIPICLPYTEESLNLTGKKALITGFGYTNPDDSPAQFLQKIFVPIQKLSYCARITESTNPIPDRFLCAGTLNRYKDAAAGDSGSPMSIRTSKSNQFLQVGIVSFGWPVPGSQTQTAAYYTDVQKMLDFIDYYSYQAGAVWCAR